METETSFPYLTDEEFGQLSIPDRTMYLAVAAQELEQRQSKLREQIKRTISEQEAGKK